MKRTLILALAMSFSIGTTEHLVTSPSSRGIENNAVYFSILAAISQVIGRDVGGCLVRLEKDYAP